MADSQPKKIIILGGGTAGWVCGAIFANSAKKNGFEVTVVDTTDIPTIGVGEASIPTIYDLLGKLGIDDSELIRNCEATFKYGIQFEGWSHPNEAYMHGFGNMGTPLNDTEFFTAWLAAAAYFTKRDLAPFTPAVTAALKNRFTRVAVRPESAPGNFYYPLTELSYALHFDASLLARLLKANALSNGAIHLSHHVRDTEQGENGITALICEDGTKLEADFFIDCSGMGGFLAKKALNCAFDDWREFLPCDRAVALQTERQSSPNLFTRSIAHEAGWRWEIPLQSRTGNGCVYCSDFMSDEDATAFLLSQVNGKVLTEPRAISFRTGRLIKPWTANCAAIGLSAGFLEPLESTSIHLICKYAMLLEENLADGPTDANARDAFNAAWRTETDEIRDFLMAHYVVNQRPEEFWRSRRDGPQPATLAAALTGLAEHGWIDLPPKALFGHDSWYQVLIGQAFPIHYKKFAAPAETAKKIIPFLQNIGQAIATETDGIAQTHQEALDSLRAPEPTV